MWDVFSRKKNCVGQHSSDCSDAKVNYKICSPIKLLLDDIHDTAGASSHVD